MQLKVGKSSEVSAYQASHELCNMKIWVGRDSGETVNGWADGAKANVKKKKKKKKFLPPKSSNQNGQGKDFKK